MLQRLKPYLEPYLRDSSTNCANYKSRKNRPKHNGINPSFRKGIDLASNASSPSNIRQQFGTPGFGYTPLEMLDRAPDISTDAHHHNPTLMHSQSQYLPYQFANTNPHTESPNVPKYQSNAHPATSCIFPADQQYGEFGRSDIDMVSDSPNLSSTFRHTELDPHSRRQSGKIVLRVFNPPKQALPNFQVTHPFIKH